MLKSKQKTIEEHADEIRKMLDCNKILIQLPEGLRWKAGEIIESLEKRGFEAIVSGGRCFGACDLPLKEASAAQVEGILHVGHRPFYVNVESEIPLYYYDWPMEFEIDEEAVSNEVAKLKEERIGLVSSVQYIEAAKKIAEVINKTGKDCKFGGYVLGCWAESAKTLFNDGYEAIIFVGSGLFHPLGFNCKYVFDLESGEIRNIEDEQMKWQMRKYARIAKAKDAKTFGIVISTKTGQKELLARAEDIKTRLEQNNKKAFIVIMDEINSDVLSQMKVDAFINTACPRVADDIWSKPLVNADDLDLLLND